MEIIENEDQPMESARGESGGGGLPTDALDEKILHNLETGSFLNR